MPAWGVGLCVFEFWVLVSGLRLFLHIGQGGGAVADAVAGTAGDGHDVGKGAGSSYFFVVKVMTVMMMWQCWR